MTIEERTILMNQYEILAKLDPDVAEKYQYKAEVLRSGYEGLYEDVLVGDSTVSEETCSEVLEILAMFATIESVMENTPSKELEGLDTESLRFNGFDLNEDDRYGVAKLLISKPDEWDRFKDRPINSHGPTALWRYQRMLPVYRQLLEEEVTPWTREHFVRLEKAALGKTKGG